MFRKEYPRPQFQRKNWLNLNGQWEFAFDDSNQGIKQKWFFKFPSQKTIQVPFVYQSPLSKINDQSFHDVVWYQRGFTLPKNFSQILILHFGAVDYQADIWLDGHFVGQHEGGETSFSFDITSFVGESKKHYLCLRVYDPQKGEEIPRGKQNWMGHNQSVWYTSITGIWQTVWIESKPKVNLDSVQYFSNIDAGTIKIKGLVNNFKPNTEVKAQINFKGKVVNQLSLLPEEKNFTLVSDLLANHILRHNFHNQGWLWSPEKPNLFEIEFKVIDPDNQVDPDIVSSYFGLRQIRTEKGMVFLNNKPYYQKLVLDQGYWPDGLWTAPSDLDFKKDIQLAKSMGFNGCRKHQKIEDPRFLYWADKLGYLVWEETAAAPAFSYKTVSRLTKEWLEIIKRDFNHPAIINWVPINESWGVAGIHNQQNQQHYTQALYHLIKALDPTRLAESNDGWEQTETDLCTIHNYGQGDVKEVTQYKNFKDTLSNEQKLINQPSNVWQIFASGFHYQGQPIILSECGGIGYEKQATKEGWGYLTVKNDTDYIKEYKRVISAIANSRSLVGFCYTQLYDVEQEKNGLATYDRKVKVDVNLIKRLNDFFIPNYVNSFDK